MPRRLVLLRHAKSEWPDGVPDEDRPLAARGRREAPLAGQWVAEHAGPVDLVVCSPARRARETCALVAAHVDAAGDPRVDERLYPGEPEDLLAVARGLPAQVHSVLFVGHNPGLEDVVAALSGSGCVLRTSAIAVLGAEGEWAEIGPGRAVLETTATPRPR